MTSALTPPHAPGLVNLEDFVVDLAAVPYVFWKQLGEAASKCDHLGRAPLMPDYWAKLHTVYLVKGAYATTAIEGNTLTEDQVMSIFKDESTLPPSREYQEQEVRNVLAAMSNGLKSNTSLPLSLEEVRLYNREILQGLSLEDHVRPGEFRQANVGVGSYRCPDWERVESLMHHFIAWYNEFPTDIDGIGVKGTAIIKAIAAHVYFVLIHPFGDGNGRTARLLEWRTLDAAGLATPATHLLSNHYNLTRDRYYQNLNHASLRANLTPFLSYAVEGLVDQLLEQLDGIYDQYECLVFEQTVRVNTPGRHADVIKRRQDLAIAILKHPDRPSVDELRTLTPALSRAYATKDEKTLTRDVNALIAAGLIVEDYRGYAAFLDPFYWRHQRDREA